jgi:hypothetical protein
MVNWLVIVARSATLYDVEFLGLAERGKLWFIMPLFMNLWFLLCSALGDR